MTPAMIGTLILVVAGQIAYQVGQRSVPRDVHPLLILALAYFAAGILCTALAWPLGAAAGSARWRLAMGWPTALIVVSIIAIELGYLLAYRAGWTIGTVFAMASTGTVVCLALYGRFVLGNSISFRQLLGLAFSSLAVWLVTAAPRAA
jgi:hypothetical protein